MKIKPFFGLLFLLTVLLAPGVVHADEFPANGTTRDHPSVEGKSTQTTPTPSAGGHNMTSPGMTDIRDIKPPVNVDIGLAIPWWVWVSAALFLLVAAGLIFRKTRGRKIRDTEVVLSPEESANRQLSEIRHLIDLDGKAFYFRLSQVFREYLDGRFKINAVEMTTEELLPRVRALGLERELEKGVRDFFNTSDPVKFARVPPVRRDMQTHLMFVIRFIKRTAPEDDMTDKPVGQSVDESYSAAAAHDHS